MAVELCDWLIENGAAVRVHDPAVKELPAKWQGRLERFEDEISMLRGARALIISTEWPQYKAVSIDAIAAVAPGITILDANRFLFRLANDSRLRYVAVGTPE
jgi:UDPglucose 6-dehydrogenase